MIHPVVLRVPDDNSSPKQLLPGNPMGYTVNSEQ